MFTHRLTLGWASGSGSLQKSFDVTGGAEAGIDEAIPADSTNLALGFTADVSQIKSLFMLSDVDVVVETNSGSIPANVFTLAAGVPFVWHTGGAALRDTAGTAVTVDITALYVTAVAAAALQIRALLDPTV